MTLQIARLDEGPDTNRTNAPAAAALPDDDETHRNVRLLLQSFGTVCGLYLRYFHVEIRPTRNFLIQLDRESLKL